MKPECISAEIERAKARATGSAGQRLFLGKQLGEIFADGERVPHLDLAAVALVDEERHLAGRRHLADPRLVVGVTIADHRFLERARRSCSSPSSRAATRSRSCGSRYRAGTPASLQCPSKLTSVWTATSLAARRSAPPRSGRSMTKAAATSSPPERRMSCDRRLGGAAGGDQVVDEQHAVARRGSRRRGSRSCRRRIRGCSPGRWSAQGSLPFLRIGTKPRPSSCATAPPRMKPRASMPATWSMPAVRNGQTSPSIAARRPAGSAISVVMSRNRIPVLG